MAEKNYGNDSQLAELVKYISDTMKFPVMGAGGGFAPIGMYGWSPDYVTGAPQGWLRCEGQEVNIADYPELATFYASQHGASNYWGGDGITTFAVPDLRGEFIRGAGTNSHANQGNGGAVGEHQDGTEHNALLSSGNSIVYLDNENKPYFNSDKDLSKDGQYQLIAKGSRGTSTGYPVYTSRPTNTSGVFFVKATVAGDPNAHHYSTEEQVVAYDTDGSEIYEITFRNDDGFIFPLDISSLSASKLKKFDRVIGKNGVNQWDLSLLNASVDFYTGNNMSAIYVSSALGDLKITEITIQYTKTS